MTIKGFLFFGFTLTFSSNINASVLNIETPADAQSAAGNPVDILATVTTSWNTITVELDNLLSDPLAVDQVITGVSFALSIYDTNVASLSSANGQLIKTPIKSTGPQNDLTDSIDHWGITSYNPNSGTTAINLSAFSGSGPPADGIIGGPGSNGEYNHVNSSITNGHAAPFILSDGTFSLHMAGVTSNTTVSSVNFTVGTTEGATLSSQALIANPEPGTWFTFLSGGLLCSAAAYRRRRTITKQSL